ncbi:YraN family protein, partial [Psychrobacter sp. T6-1]
MADLSTSDTSERSSTNIVKRPLQLSSPKQRQGGYFEQQACSFLQIQGLTLIAQNWQQPKVGELDLVMI